MKTKDVKVVPEVSQLDRIEASLKSMNDRLEASIGAVSDAIERLDETIFLLESGQRADWFREMNES